MIFKKKQLISDTKDFSYNLLLEIQKMDNTTILDTTISDILYIYDDYAKDCLKTNVSLKEIKKHLPVFALVTLLRACAGLLTAPYLSDKYILYNRNLTPQGKSLYAVYNWLVDASIGYIGFSKEIHMQQKEVEDYLFSKTSSQDATVIDSENLGETLEEKKQFNSKLELGINCFISHYTNELGLEYGESILDGIMTYYDIFKTKYIMELKRLKLNELTNKTIAVATILICHHALTNTDTEYRDLFYNQYDELDDIGREFFYFYDAIMNDSLSKGYIDEKEATERIEQIWSQIGILYK